VPFVVVVLQKRWGLLICGCGVYCPNRQNTSRQIDNLIVEILPRENFAKRRRRILCSGFLLRIIRALFP
jgi:hypothetical protein